MQVLSVPLPDITILRTKRQRRDFTTEDLEDSFKQRGQLQPIVIRRPDQTQEEEQEITTPYVLCAGERRYTAAKKVGWESIFAIFKSDLPADEAEIIELEENYKRKNLSWQDESRAIFNLHLRYSKKNGQDWTAQASSILLGIEYSQFRKIIRVAKEIDNPKIAGAPGMITAYNMLVRVDERKTADALNDILTASIDIFNEGAEPFPIPEEEASPPPLPRPSASHAQPASGRPITLPPIPGPKPKPAVRVKPAEKSVLHEDFMKWAPKYTGQPFNLIHCDFPYGVGVFGGDQSGRKKHEEYNDQESSYWELLQCMCTNLDRIMAPSAHLIFWFSMEYYWLTLERFRKWAPSLTVQVFPLIWHKSDNVGILADPKRGPRRIYETALIASREDRFIVKSVSNHYSCPTDKAHHPSTKPEPMLRYFFQMFVDEHTRMLDPTCGGGSALRAAESLGAGHVLGLEKSEQYYNNAVTALRTFRTLRAVNK